MKRKPTKNLNNFHCLDRVESPSLQGGEDVKNRFETTPKRKRLIDGLDINQNRKGIVAIDLREWQS